MAPRRIKSKKQKANHDLNPNHPIKSNHANGPKEGLAGLSGEIGRTYGANEHKVRLGMDMNGEWSDDSGCRRSGVVGEDCRG